MSTTFYNFEKIEKKLKELKFTKPQIKKAYYSILIGDRFFKTNEDTKKLVKKISTGKKQKAKVQELIKKFTLDLKPKINKIDTLWDITWNSNCENVQRMVKSWSFNNIHFYNNKSILVMDEYLQFTLKTIIWIQLGLSYESTKKVANEICILIKHIDKWVSGLFIEYSFTGEIDKRLTIVKALLIDELGIDVENIINQLEAKALQRIESLSYMDVSYNALENLIKKEKELDELLEIERQKAIARIEKLKSRNILEDIFEQEKLLSEFRILMDENYKLLTKDLIKELLIENNITDLNQISDYDLIKMINDKIKANAKRNKNLLDQLFAAERFIQTPRYKLKKIDKSILVEDDYETLVLEKFVLKD